MSIAIITGASSGLGLEFTKQIKQYFPTITEYWVIARRTDRLNQLHIPGITIRPISLDLTEHTSFQHLETLLARERPEVTLLINNAGCGYLGNFYDADLSEQLRMTELNIGALTAVTGTVLPYMPKNSRIINISSIASFVPTPRMTVYSSTKAYVSSFSRGLHEELKPRKISVTAVCPGPMETEFLSVGRIKGQSKTFDMLPYCVPAKVVSGALKAAKAGKAVYTPHPFYKLYRVLGSLIPHAIFIKFAKT